MRSAITALIALSLLTSCSTGPFKSKPDVIQYSKELQGSTAQEIRDAKCDPHLNHWSECKIPQIMEMLKDYWVMRRQAEV